MAGTKLVVLTVTKASIVLLSAYFAFPLASKFNEDGSMYDARLISHLMMFAYVMVIVIWVAEPVRLFFSRKETKQQTKNNNRHW
ncbi:hypothetical protein KC887_08980 [Candidatus Kaiserbacteria bacterium]|nr:hypothetical protein [Candidatus Kaiserbacteria bacterium]